MEYYDPRDYDLAGRIARLRTLHGTIETPYLFPVVDPIRQTPSLNEIEEIGFNAFITNAYLFYRRNRGRVVEIHSSFKWDKPIMTDSGGYQILLYGSVEVDNITIVEYQKNIGSDIAVILDIPTGTKMSWREAWDAVRETFKRGWEALPHIMDSKQLWTFPIQGAPYRDLLQYSSILGSRMPYHVYALGSPTVYLEKYEYEGILEYTIIAKMNLPPHKPLHVFGVGHPMIIPYLVAVGADLFDSASYILYARDERFMFEWGTRRLDELFYLPCNCPICSRYSVEELREMKRSERIKYIALHNLYILKKEFDRVKQAIKEGRLWEYLEQRSKMHPSLHRAFNVLKKYIDLLKRYNPYTKTPTQALLLIGRDSLYNPRLIMVKEKTYGLIVRNKLKYIVLIPVREKPFTNEKLYQKVQREYRGYQILFYHPYLGLFPPKLSNTYPYFQHEVGEIKYYEEIGREIVEVLKSIDPMEIIAFKPSDPSYSRIIDDLIKYFGERVKVIHA